MKNSLKDRHVLAVAVHAGAETWDQRPAAMSSVLQHSADSLGCGTVSDFLQQLKRLPRLTSMTLGSGSDREPL